MLRLMLRLMLLRTVLTQLIAGVRAASLGNVDGVRIRDVREYGEAIQAIAADVAPRFQAVLCPDSNRLIGKVGHRGCR